MLKENVHEIDKIMDITTRIVETVHPQKVILFGSFARGEQNHNSDYDLFILADDTDRDNFTKQYINSRKSIRHMNRRAVDIVFNTKNKFDKKKNSRANIDYFVNQEGVVLYEQ